MADETNRGGEEQKPTVARLFDTSIKDINDIPKDKLPDRDAEKNGPLGGHTAQNSGVVQMFAVINRKCPFMATAAFNDAIIFNAQTIRNYPPSLLRSIATVPGTEGIFLQPKFVYRHTFVSGISRIDPDDAEAINFREQNPYSEFYEIETDELDEPGGIFADDDDRPIYEVDQEFIIGRSLFKKDVILPSEYLVTNEESREVCDEPAVWEYEAVDLGESRSEDTTSRNVLMPTQIAGTTCSGLGVHWQLAKRTPLFKGEDFFVHYRRLAASIDIPDSFDPDIYDFDDFPERMKPLNVDDEQPIFVQNACGENVEIKRNSGLVNWTKNRDGTFSPTNKSSYDFKDQAYLIIEIGVKDPFHNYFLIITQRSQPTLVRIQDGRSVVVSTFDNGQIVSRNAQNRVTSGGLNGNALFSAEWFRTEVRNHLGQLVVRFVGPSFVSNYWIINRLDTEEPKEPREQEGASAVIPQLVQKPVVMFVPEAPISLWGGNLNCGVLFGPIQYQQGESESNESQSQEESPNNNENLNFANASASPKPLSFRFPPMTVEQEASDGCEGVTESRSGENFEVETGSIRGNAECNKAGRVVLPAFRKDKRARNLTSKHSILLDSTDNKIVDIVKYADDKNEKEHLFTQDAQEFEMLVEERSKTIQGSFYKGPSLKAIDPSGDISKLTVEKVDEVADCDNRATMFRVLFSMYAGGHTFPSNWRLPSCKTPVLTMARLVSPEIDIPRWNTQAVDVSEHVLEYTESWSAQDFTKIEHTGNITFLLNQGAEYENDQTEALLSYVNKAFYIEIWAGYTEPGEVEITQGSVDTFGTDNACNYSKIPGMYKLFTGVCYGGVVEREVGKRVLKCSVQDYSEILKHQMFFNSPFFDGVRDHNAINEILSFAGFRKDENDMPRRLIDQFANTDKEYHFAIAADGRPLFSGRYALPSAYAKLQQPFFKYEDGKNYYDAVMDIAKRGGKCFFFDSHGVAHLDSYFDFSVVSSIKGVADEMTKALREAGAEREFEDLTPWWYTTNPDIFEGQMVYSSISIERSVIDVYNHVKIMTNTPDFELIHIDDVSWDSFDDPTKEGFIGYLKTVYQRDGVFGSLEAATNIVDFYSAMRRPPLVLKFESYGLPVRALDNIRLDGQTARVMRVDATINPAQNRWWNSFECEWLYPINIDNLQRKPRVNKETSEPPGPGDYPATGTDLA